jgi:hypothetical protein
VIPVAIIGILVIAVALYYSKRQTALGREETPEGPSELRADAYAAAAAANPRPGEPKQGKKK